MKTKFEEIIDTLSLSDEQRQGISQLKRDLSYGGKDLIWQTDCFLVSWLSKELTAAGLLDDAVLEALGSDIQGRMPFLQKMLSHQGRYDLFMQKTSPYLFFVGDSICYGVLDDFARKFGAAFERAGYRVIYQDRQNIGKEYYEKFNGNSYRAIFTMQDQIVSEKVAGKNLLGSLNAPVYFFSFDHPGSFCNIIHNSPEYMTVLTLDQYYLKYTEKYLRRKAIFFPPGGEELEERYSVFDDFKTKKLKENKIDFSFFGTPGQGIDEMVKWFYDNSKDSFPVMKSFADHLKSETDQPSDEVFHHTLDEMTQIDTPLSDDEFASEFAKWVVFEKNISQTFRQKVVNQIVLSGMNFDLYGDGWEKELPFDIFNNEIGRCGLRMHGSVPYNRVKDIYRQSWMSLNVMAWHKAGFTERIAEPQLAGSLVVTDSTEYLKKYYTDGEDIILFDLSDESIRELPNRLKALLSDKDRLLHMAWNGYQKALKYHTWDARVKQFLEITVDNT